MLALQHSTALQYFIGMALPWFWNWKLLIFLAWVLRCCSKLSFTKCVKSSQLCDGDVNGKPNCNSPLLLPFWLTLLLKKSTAKKGATIFALLTCQICFCPCNQVIEFAKKQNRRGSYIKGPSVQQLGLYCSHSMDFVKKSRIKSDLSYTFWYVITIATIMNRAFKISRPFILS